MRLSFDPTEHLVVIRDDGTQARVANPFATDGADGLIRADSLLDGRFRLVGGRVEAGPEVSAPRISIDFHAPHGGWLVHR